jgi:hypothetical protein
MGKEKLQKLKDDVIKVFMEQPFSLMQKEFLQQMSKVTGICFQNGTISTTEKLGIISLVLKQLSNRARSSKNQTINFPSNGY